VEVDLSIVMAKEVSHKFKDAAEHHICCQEKNSRKVIIETRDVLPVKDVVVLDKLTQCQLGQTA